MQLRDPSVPFSRPPDNATVQRHDKQVVYNSNSQGVGDIDKTNITQVHFDNVTRGIEFDHARRSLARARVCV